MVTASMGAKKSSGRWRFSRAPKVTLIIGACPTG
jgi:hypothetical protein